MKEDQISEKQKFLQENLLILPYLSVVGRPSMLLELEMKLEKLPFQCMEG